MRARYYSVELMRFINEDIVLGDIGNSSSLNRYTYVEGNPATMVDPFGLEAEKASAKAWKWGTDILKTIAGVGIMCIPGGQAVGAGIGGIAGGYIAEGTYKAFTGEDSETAFLVGNTLGNLLGDLAGAKIYTGIASKAAAAVNKGSGPSTKAYMTGKDGESELADMFGGESQAFFKTSYGARYVDQLADGVAHESKVGYTSLTQFVKKQVLKDAEILERGDVVDEIVWHFFRVE